MIELKITAETASELTSEIQELAQQVVGTHLCDCQDGKLVEAPVVEAKPKEEKPKEEKPKKSKKAAKPVEEKAEAPVEPEVKEEAPKVEAPKAETPKEETKSYKIDKVRGAVKDFVQDNPDNKAKIATFLHDDLGVKSISEAPADVYPKIMEFVGADK